MKKITKILCLILCISFLFSGCGTKDNNQAKEQKEEKKLKIVDLSSNTRPYAVMINNHPSARQNHAGLQDAYLIYEMIVEGGMTRYMAVFKDKDTAKIGSVRSSRHYFLDYAMENDAMYVHWGWSPQAQSDISTYGINNINGAELENKIYRFGDIADVATKTENAKSTVLLKVKGNLTINEGVTLTTCKSADGYGGPKGFLIYCTGTITNNGEISMTDKGAKAEGEDVFLYKNGNDQYEYVPATGAKGGEPVSAWTHYMHIKGEHYETINGSSPGLKGEDGTNRKTGGGASGAASAWGATTTGMSTWAYSGKGGKGTSYSGGNDGQSVATSATGKTITGNSGTEIGGNAGGLLIIFANSIQNTGKITSNGVKGIYNNGTGGGSINIFYKRYITQGTIEAKGGIGNDSNGGDGSVTIKHIEDLDLK